MRLFLFGFLGLILLTAIGVIRSLNFLLCILDDGVQEMVVPDEET